MPIRIEISSAEVQAKVKTAWEKGLYELSNEILADCNEYCKEDTGALIASSHIHSQPQKGTLIWQTPYAKRQYWAIQTSLRPGRTWKWCETAKSKWKSRWQKLAEEGLKKNL
jgi:hypothetical protein